MKYLIAVGFALSLAVPAAAQPTKRVPVRVGPIATAQQCTVYEGVKASSRSSVAAAAGGYAGVFGGAGYAGFAASSQSSFETFFVKDCVRNFEGIRAALQSALASSGTISVGPGGYVLTGRMENVVPIGAGFEDTGGNGSDYGSVSNGLLVTLSVSVADRAGRIIFGAPVVAQIETGYAGTARSTSVERQMTGEGLYSILQRQVALAVARKVAFHFTPLTVIQGGGRKIQLNYGGPLLEAGTLLSVIAPDGNAARYRVTATGDAIASAEQVGDADSRAVGPGSHATVIEEGDPAANQSTMERVELP